MKAKKVLAMLMATAMIMGTTVTAFAAPDSDPTTSNIIVEGLAQEEDDTVVNLFAAITWNEEASRWDIADWAEPYIDTTDDPYEIKEGMEALLVDAVQGAPTKQITLEADDTSVTFENMPVGAYVITASGTSASYAPMVVETYKGDETYMTAEDKTVTAKTDGYQLTKQQKVEEGGNKFVGRGETVTFEIVTTFPSFPDPDAADNTYKIVDTPDGLNITGVNSITIGGTILGEEAYGTDEVEKSDGSTQSYEIDLTSQIGTTNANAGKTVTIEYSAVVTDEDGYSNTANATRNEINIGTGEEEGYTADITVTKYNEDSTQVLNGAEFQVYHGTKDQVEAEGSELTPLNFVKISDGVYKLALPGESGANTTIVATNGKVQIKGLEEGNYWFKETKAPEGYSINEAGVPIEITKGEADAATGNIPKTGSLTDTKLSELPSTGGIGTTIFTVGGCVIMITAAGLYFATRKKEQN